MRLSVRSQWTVIAIMGIAVSLAVAVRVRSGPAQVLSIGDTVPLFKGLRMLNAHSTTPDRAVRLNDGPSLVVVWASWCPACRSEMASLAQADRILRGKGLHVTTVSVDRSDDEAAVRRIIMDADARFDVILDPEGLVGRTLGVVPIPQAFLVSADGVIRDRFIGAREWTDSTMMARLQSVLTQ